jgi:hypothetical protein
MKMKLTEYAKTLLIQALSDSEVPEKYIDRVVEYINSRFEDNPTGLIELLNRELIETKIIDVDEFCTKVENTWNKPTSEFKILLPEGTERLAEWQIEESITIVEIISDYGEVYEIDIFVTDN